MRSPLPPLMALTIALAMLVTLSGCTSTASAASSDLPITLTVGTNDKAGTSVALEVEHFAAAVRVATHGSIIVTPRFGFGGDSTPHWDQVVGQAVIDGKLDMGAVPTRAWDALGVTSLRAINAPFVVTSDAALVAAAGDAIAKPMLAGLSKAGVTGLELLPESLRHPNGFHTPFLGQSDYSGAVIRSPYSKTTWALMSALGAKPVDGAIDDTVQDALETSYARGAGPVMTGNVTFFAKIDALVVNTKKFTTLSASQRKILASAAAATRDWVIANLPTDRELATTFCSHGGTIVGADSAQLVTLVDAAAPLMATLQADKTTAAAIVALRAVPPQAPPPTSCADAGTTAPAAALTLDGTFTFTTTRDQLVAGGVTDSAQLTEESATFVWHFAQGGWSYRATSDHPLTQPERHGLYSLQGDRLTIFWSGTITDYTEATVSIQPDGALRFSAVTDSDPGFQNASVVKFTNHDWTRSAG